MKSIRTVLASAAVAVAVAFSSAPASAQQQITDEHLQAATRAMLAAEADQNFNTVLPDVAFQVQAVLIERRPDLHRQISETVMQIAAELIPQRVAFNDEVARLWAQTFTLEELNAISAFYESPAGRKLVISGPLLYADTISAMSAWSDRVGQEMLQRAVTVFEQQGQL